MVTSRSSGHRRPCVAVTSSSPLHLHQVWGCMARRHFFSLAHKGTLRTTYDWTSTGKIGRRNNGCLDSRTRCTACNRGLHHLMGKSGKAQAAIGVVHRTTSDKLTTICRMPIGDGSHSIAKHVSVFPKRHAIKMSTNRRIRRMGSSNARCSR